MFNIFPTLIRFRRQIKAALPTRRSKLLQAHPAFAHCQGPVIDKDLLCYHIYITTSHFHSDHIHPHRKDLFCKVDEAGEGEDGDSDEDEEEAELFVSLNKVAMLVAIRKVVMREACKVCKSIVWHGQGLA